MENNDILSRAEQLELYKVMKNLIGISGSAYYSTLPFKSNLLLFNPIYLLLLLLFIIVIIVWYMMTTNVLARKEILFLS